MLRREREENHSFDDATSRCRFAELSLCFFFGRDSSSVFISAGLQVSED